MMSLRITFVSLILFVVAAADAHEPYVPYLQKELLRQIADCTTKTCVDAALSTAPYLDSPLKLIAASKIHALKGDGAQARLLEAIPRDPIALWFCYSVTMPTLGENFEHVRDLYDTFFPAAAAAASERGDLTDFLRLAAFADGEMAAAIAEDIESIKKRNARAYCAALEKLHSEVQRSLPPCGGDRRK